MALKLITAPIALPVALADAKAHLRLDTTSDDAMVAAMIGAATEAAEHYTGRALMAQTWEIALDAFPAALELTRIPVASVVSIQYADVAGVMQTLSPTAYALDNADGFGPAFVVPAYGTGWPVTRDQINAVKVQYIAGYLDAASVPQSIKSWILLQCGAMFENRESEVVERGSAISLGFVDRLLDRFVVYA